MQINLSIIERKMKTVNSFLLALVSRELNLHCVSEKTSPLFIIVIENFETNYVYRVDPKKYKFDYSCNNFVYCQPTFITFGTCTL